MENSKDIAKTGTPTAEENIEFNQIEEKHQPSQSVAQIENGVYEEKNESPKKEIKFGLKKISIKINKPLIPLKFALFLWFGAGTALSTFFLLYLKQRGLSVAQISTINIIAPACQLFGPPISGAIADKIGRAKPVLLGNMVLALIFANAVFFMPRMPQVEVPQSMSIECTENVPAHLPFNKDSEWNSHFLNCSLECELNSTFPSFDDLCLPKKEIMCHIQMMFDSHSEDFTAACQDNHWYKVRKAIMVDVISPTIDPLNSFNCSSTCAKNLDERENAMWVFVLSLILITGFYTVYSNIFRFLDITSMYMVKAHNSDFGRERIWSILGAIVFPLFIGYLVESTTPEGDLANYSVSFYVFDVMAVLAMIAVFRLEVQVKPPGENMLKKTLSLLKSLDMVCFAFALLVLGTGWSFTKYFASLYLVDLKGTSMLVSLHASLGSVYGLPFLLTSNWWVEKIGATNLLVCAFFAYFVDCLLYSFLVNPWLCLLIDLSGIFTYHLCWVSVVRYAHESAPDGLTATVIASAGGIHYAGGRATGSSIGGLVMSQYGGRLAFRVMAGLCGISGALYATFLFVRRKKSSREIDFKSDGDKEMDK